MGRLSKMRLLVLTASLWAFASAKPEMYKETEDFQYARSSTDEGSKSGFYGAQRGNMGGNYEKAHNMDTMAQHHMSTLVRQVDGELGDGANTKTGSVYTAGKSRGIFGSGNYDLSNLGGRNFGESGHYEDTISQGANRRAGYSSNSYGTNSASYGSQQSHSSSSKHGGYASSNLASQYAASDLESLDKYRTSQQSLSSNTNQNVYAASNLASQYAASDVEGADKYHGASNYEYGSHGGSNLRYYSLANSQAGHEYDQSNANTYSNYGLRNQNRLVAAPVKVYVRPGGRVAVPISAQTYALHSASLQDKNIADASSDSAVDVLNNGIGMTYKPTSNAKHYESAYSYHKKWEKHDTQPVVIPTENPFPANSELYEDKLDQNGQSQSGLDLSSSRSANVNSGYANIRHNYESDVASSHAQSGKASGAYSSGYSSNTKTASSNQARHQTLALHKDASANSNAYTMGTHDLGASTANLNNLVEDINTRPKSYHSSYSYHKAWERRGDPYVIRPAGDATQSSQRLTAASESQSQYGSNYNQNSYVSSDCDILCHQRRKRSYDMNQYEQNSDDSQNYLGQQLDNAWDLGQQTENKFENLEDLGQETQNSWDNLESLNQHSQNKWNNLQALGQETQNKWDKTEDLGQQTQNKWDSLTDFGQQTQDDLAQQTENQKAKLEDLGQETQNQVNKLRDLGQQAQEQWGKLEDLGQKTQNQWDDLGQKTQSQWDDLGQKTQSQWDDLGQKTQSQWDDLGQQAQNKWEGLGQQAQEQWGKLEDLGQETQNQWNNFGQQSQNQWDNLESLGQQTITDMNKEKNVNQAHRTLEEKAEAQTTETEDNDNSQRDKTTPKLENNEQQTIDQKFLWDEISQMFEDPTNTEVDESNADFKPKENDHTVLVTPSKETRDSLITESLVNAERKEQEKPNKTPTNPFVLGHDDSNSADKQTEIKPDSHQPSLEDQTQKKDVRQDTENLWTGLGQETENQWSYFGQQTQNHWSELGQETQNQWSDLSQQTQNQWGDLSQQTQSQWSDLFQRPQNQWGDLSQQTQSQWGDLSQQIHNQFNDLSQQTQSQWGDLSQQTQSQWDNLNQQIHNQWHDLSQQTHNQGGYLVNFDQQTQSDKDERQNKDEDKRTAEDKSQAPKQNKNIQSLEEALIHMFGEVNEHQQTDGQNQQDVQETVQFHIDDKDEQNKHNVEHVSHEEITPVKPVITIQEHNIPILTTTEIQILPTNNKDIGRGDIGAEDEAHDSDTLDIKPLSSTTEKARDNRRRPLRQRLNESPINHEVIRQEFKPESQSVANKIPSRPVESQYADQQENQFEEQSIDIQQSQQTLNIPSEKRGNYETFYITPSAIHPHPQELGRSLQSQPQEIVQQKNLEVKQFNQILEQERKLESEHLQTTEPIPIDTPVEPTTQKPGFWNSVWNKTKKTKDSVLSWFKS